jgi:hypothetical protein
MGSDILQFKTLCFLPRAKPSRVLRNLCNVGHVKFSSAEIRQSVRKDKYVKKNSK